MRLQDYLGKRVRIVDDDGETTEGKCVSFTPAFDNEPEIDAIEVETVPDAGYTIGFTADEIKSIEEIWI